jgi:hypothetical protein
MDGRRLTKSARARLNTGTTCWCAALPLGSWCYGDVCQSITDLAVETRAPISSDDFRTLNRCLDDAIAGAVTEFAREQDIGRDADTSELWSL